MLLTQSIELLTICCMKLYVFNATKVVNSVVLSPVYETKCLRASGWYNAIRGDGGVFVSGIICFTERINLFVYIVESVKTIGTEWKYNSGVVIPSHNSGYTFNMAETYS